MNNCWRLLVVLAAVVFISASAGHAHGSIRAAMHSAGADLTGVDACAGSSGAEAVVQFYLALDRRQFGAAYRCLDPSLRGSMSLESFANGYATMLESRLLIADELPERDRLADTPVSIDLHAVDREGSRFLVSTYRGTWTVRVDGALLHPAIRLIRRVLVSRVPPTDVADVFAFDQQRIVSAVQADVTGDGVPDNLYITSGRAGQQAWIFSQGRLVFAEIPSSYGVPAGVRALVPGADHHSFVLTENNPPSFSSPYENWVWTPVGFLGVDVPGVVMQPTVAQAGQLVHLQGHVPPPLANVASGDPGIVLMSLTGSVANFVGECGGSWGPNVEISVVQGGVGQPWGPEGTPWSNSFRVPNVPPSLYAVALPYLECGGGYAMAYLLVTPGR